MSDPTLAEYLARLKAAEVDPLPEGPEDWAEHVRRISVDGRIVEVTEDHYWYWLEVLPPRWMRGSHFCFAEGEEAFRLFWQDRRGGYFARKLSNEETLQFCRLSGVAPPLIPGGLP